MEYNEELSAAADKVLESWENEKLFDSVGWEGTEENNIENPVGLLNDILLSEIEKYFLYGNVIEAEHITPKGFCVFHTPKEWETLNDMELPGGSLVWMWGRFMHSDEECWTCAGWHSARHRMKAGMVSYVVVADPCLGRPLDKWKPE